MRIIIVTVIFISELFILQAQQDTLKIMPLGDSITRGVSVTTNAFGRAGYRKPLIDSLNSLGYISAVNTSGFPADFDFVGNQNQPISTTQIGVDTFDVNHQGHSGWQASNPTNTAISLYHNLNNFLSINPPNIILLHIGTNDISAGDNVSNLVSEVSSILDNIYNFNPQIRVVLSKIINRIYPDSLIDTTTEFNNALDTMANTRITNGDKLYLVDMETGAGINYLVGPNNPPNPAFDMGDTLHPNNNGYRKIANVWFNKIKELLIPTLVSPPNESINHPVEVTFSWNPAMGANTYRFQIATDNNFTMTSIIVDSTLTDTSALVILQENANYYWRVSAKINTGSSPFSEVWTLTTVLPVELSAFNLILKDNNVELFWQTETEINNLGFNIERNINSSQWEIIGFVQGNGNSNSTKNYSYADKNITGGSKFIYRLKQIDNDGTFSYSNEIEIDIVPEEFELYQNYPNPFNPFTNIKFSLPHSSKVRIDVYNIIGQLLETIINQELETGFYDFVFDAGNFPSGTYIYRFQAGDFSQTKKMLLLK